MTGLIDGVIDQITMYRLVLYVLVGYVAVGSVLAFAGLLAFSPLALLISTIFLVVMCWAANTVLARIFHVPTNVESATITALILALILDPARTGSDLSVLGWAAILAMASKYILAVSNKHLFNPAAIAVLLTGFALKDAASWWVGTTSMFPVVLIGGFLIVRKLRQESMVVSFLAAAIVAETLVSLLQHTSVSAQFGRLLFQSPLVFFATVMLTEPLTAPPTATLRRVYGLLTGILFTPQLHLGPVYSTPELALVLGNLYAYVVSPKQKFVLQIKRKTRLSRDTVDFAFARPDGLAFAPGQYMEWTLEYPHSDSRGNRRFFTLASSPTEPMLHLGVKFSKPGSTFKGAMLGLNGRVPILAGQVAGDFTLPRDPTQKLAFIAGGIGITPFRSMLKYLIDTGERRDIVLIYVNRTADDIVYRDVLEEARKRLDIQTIYTLTDASAVPGNWRGCVGRLDAAMIAEVIPDYRERVFYLSGPPGMVRSAEHALRTMHLAGSRIKTDFFPGLA